MQRIFVILISVWILFFVICQRAIGADCSINSGSDTNISADCDGFNLNSSNSNTITIDLGVTVSDDSSVIFLAEDLLKLDIKGVVQPTDEFAYGLYLNQYDKSNTVTLTTLDVSGTLGSSGADGRGGIYMHNYPPRNGNTVIGTLNNTGTIIGDTAMSLNSRSIITTLNNSGLITANNGAGIVHYGNNTQADNGYFGTINNSGTIRATAAGIHLYNHVYITDLVNTGTILTSGVGSDIDLSGSSYITNLYNDQGGADSLTINKVPTNYYIIINNETDYGKVKFNSVSSGTMNFNIDTTRSASGIDGTTYSSVIEDLTTDRLSATSGTSGAYTWTLSDSDNDNTWDLVIDSNAPSASNTMTTISNLTYATSAVFNSFSYSSSFANLSGYDCGIFDESGLCGAFFSKLVDSNGSNDTDFDNTAGQMVSGLKINNNFRLAAFIDHMTNNNSPSSIVLENDSPMIGGSTVWNQNKNKLGFEAKIMAAHQSKEITSTRKVVGDAEAGSGKTDIEMKTYMAELSYQYIINPLLAIKPFSGFRYSSIKQNSYTESGVANPLTFSSVSDETNTLIFGVRGKYLFNSKLVLTGTLTLERDIKNSISDVTTSSATISGLTTVSLHNGGGIDKTRGSVGATLDYFVAKDAKISFHSNFQELRYHNSDSENFYISYALGF